LTRTPTLSPTLTTTQSPTPTPTPKNNPKETDTPTPTVTKSVTPTATATVTATATPPAKTQFIFLPLVLKQALSCEQAVQNPGFEWIGSWIVPSTDYSARYTDVHAHSGSRSMQTGIINPSINLHSYSSFQQLVTIPADAQSAKLTVHFWLESSDPGATNGEVPFTGATIPSFEEGMLSAAGLPSGILPILLSDPASDVQYVSVLDQNQNLLETLVWQKKNAPSWAELNFDLLKYKGKSIYLHFGTYNDGLNGITAMFVDDVTLDVCR
jgi:hypothetical protein